MPVAKLTKKFATWMEGYLKVQNKNVRKQLINVRAQSLIAREWMNILQWFGCTFRKTGFWKKHMDRFAGPLVQRISEVEHEGSFNATSIGVLVDLLDKYIFQSKNFVPSAETVAFFRTTMTVNDPKLFNLPDGNPDKVPSVDRHGRKYKETKLLTPICPSSTTTNYREYNFIAFNVVQNRTKGHNFLPGTFDITQVGEEGHENMIPENMKRVTLGQLARLLMCGDMPYRTLKKQVSQSDISHDNLEGKVPT